MENPIHLNLKAASWTWQSPKPAESPLKLHRSLPDYGPTPLISLPTIAAELGLGHVLLKDESNRFGLPSFKILGASWAVYRAVAERLGYRVGDVDDASRILTVESMGTLAKSAGLHLVTATEGNWGRAVARMGSYMAGLPVTIFVPGFMPETTRKKIRGEGADVVVVDGNYDDAVAAAREEVERLGRDTGLLVMDFGWEGYEVIPEYVVEGYSTMLDESDQQVLEETDGKPATHAIVPVGVGSIAQAVTQHFKGAARLSGSAKVLTVEPDTASSLKSSLEAGSMTTVPTENTIMCGMNCGTVSTTAWPVLQAGVDASVIVADNETHQAVLDLDLLGVCAGPCGASTLAALRRAVRGHKEQLGLDETSVVVLLCTEGAREYDMPS